MPTTRVVVCRVGLKPFGPTISTVTPWHTNTTANTDAYPLPAIPRRVSRCSVGVRIKLNGTPRAILGLSPLNEHRHDDVDKAGWESLSRAIRLPMPEFALMPWNLMHGGLKNGVAPLADAGTRDRRLWQV